MKYRGAFHQISGIGPAIFTKLESRFGNLEDAWSAPLSDLVAAGVSRKAAGEAERFSDENELGEVLAEIARLGIQPRHLRHPE